MNVLSLFDGLAVGRLALDKAGKRVDNYFASEINKKVVDLVAQRRPDVQQLGDVKDWATWGLPKIDLLIGGSPCQGFSFCGKQLNFKDPRSILFFEYAKILHKLKPTWFLLENVKMSQRFQDVISNELGVKPVEIDSVSFAPQTRKRLYWTNIPIDPISSEPFTLDRGQVNLLLLRNNHCQVSDSARAKILQRYRNNASLRIMDITTLGLSKVQHYTEHPVFYNYWNDRMFYKQAPTLTTYSGSWSAKVGLVCPQNRPDGKYVFIKVTPSIFEYLQTLPIGYTEGLTRTEAFTALGNCWTKDVIAHIFKGL